ncbi:MAG: PfkB family carbohydrate kinase [Rhodobacteraceae bacterium]|nr:PfkB family carbohydrate kinase [Paracoccaceae bacterium]
MSLWVVGSLHLDVIVEAPRLPKLDETLAGQGVSYRFGGKGGNQAVAAARMGARVAMTGAVGSDAFAEALLEGLDAAGVDRTRVARLPGASGMSVAILDPRGDYAAVIVSAANLSVAGEGPPPAGATHLLLQNEIPEAANLAAARAARAAGLRVLLNAAPARPVAPELLALADLLVVNRLEAAQLTGLPEDAHEAAALALLERGPRHVVVTLGAGGLHCRCRSDEALTLPAPRVAVVSTHGAGDAFTGALAARLDAGAAMPEALAFAQGAAALHVATPPDRRAAITPRAVEALL